MTNIWRRFPSGRIAAGDLIRKTSDADNAAAARITVGFFENPQTNTNASTTTVGSVGSATVIDPIVINSPDTAVDPFWAETTYRLILFKSRGTSSGSYHIKSATGTVNTVSPKHSYLEQDGPNGEWALHYPEAKTGTFYYANFSGFTAKTFEFYIRTTDTTCRILGGNAAESSLGYAAGVLTLYDFYGSVETSGSAPTLSDGEWHHIAITHSDTNVYRLFFDGALIGTSAVSTANDVVCVFFDRSVYHSLETFVGAIAMLRETAGAERYTTSFTRPTSYLLSAPAEYITFQMDSKGTVTLPVGDGDPFWDKVQFLYKFRNGDTYAQNYSLSTLEQARGDSTADSPFYAQYPDEKSLLSGSFSRIPFGGSQVNHEFFFWELGSDTTFDVWVRPQAANKVLITGGGSFILSINASSFITAQMWEDAGGSFTLTSASSVALLTWHHIALVGVGNTVTMYVNGVSAGSNTLVARPYTDNPTLDYAAGQASYYDFRMTRDVRWSSAFTPPTKPATTYQGVVVTYSYGDGANTVADFTGTGTGTQSLPWNGANTLESFTSVGAGEVTATNPTVGENTVDPVTQVSTATAWITATGGSTLASVPSAGTGTTILTIYDLLLYLPYDKWKDASLHDHSFSVSPGAKLSPTQSKFGGMSVTFTGSGDSVRVPLQGFGAKYYAKTSPTFSQDQTHSFWVFIPTSASNSSGRLLGVNYYGSTDGASSKTDYLGWQLEYAVGGFLRLRRVSWYQPGGGFQESLNTTTTVVPKEQWVHICVSYASSNNRLRMFFDGVNVLSEPLAWPDIFRYGSNDDSHAFSLGADSYDTALRIYSAATNQFLDDYQWSTLALESDASFTPPTARRILSDPFAALTGVGQNALAASTNTTSGGVSNSGSGSNTITLIPPQTYVTEGMDQIWVTLCAGVVQPVGSTLLVGSSALAPLAATGAAQAILTVTGPDPLWTAVGLLVKHDIRGINDKWLAPLEWSYGGHDESPRPKGNKGEDWSSYYDLNGDTPFDIGASVGVSEYRNFALRASPDTPDWNYVEDLRIKRGTVEVWFKHLDDAAGGVVLFSWFRGFDYNIKLTCDNATGGLTLRDYAAKEWHVPAIIPRGQWVHVAMVLDTIPLNYPVDAYEKATVFVGGQKVLDVAVTLELDVFGSINSINLPGPDTASFNLLSLQDDFRWTSGYKLYTENFTPPTAPMYVRPPDVSMTQTPVIAGPAYTVEITSRGRGTVITPRIANGRVLYVDEITSNETPGLGVRGGTGDFTLANFTGSGAGVVVAPNAATGANTTAAFTQTAAGQVRVTGAGANTATQTQSSVGGVRATGAGANTAVQSSVGSGAAPTTGSGGTTLSAFTQVAAGGTRATGAGANTAASFTQTGTGIAISGGAGTNTVTSFTQLSTAVVDVRGNSVVVTTSFVVTSAGVVLVRGNSSTVTEPHTCVGAFLNTHIPSGSVFATTLDSPSFVWRADTTAVATTFDIPSFTRGADTAAVATLLNSPAFCAGVDTTTVATILDSPIFARSTDDTTVAKTSGSPIFAEDVDASTVVTTQSNQVVVRAEA